jgi:hypothetical protein
MDEIRNKVADSGLLSLDLERYLPPILVLGFDLANWLDQGLVLREANFKEQLKSMDWSDFKEKDVAVYCSTEAIVPAWAFMWLSRDLAGVGARMYIGLPDEINARLFLSNLERMVEQDASLNGARVIVKGCSTKKVPQEAYPLLTRLLLGRAKSLMFGEPCSTVPVFKRA